MAIKRWNANTSTWELVGTPGTVTPAAIGAPSLSGTNVFTGQNGFGLAPVGANRVTIGGTSFTLDLHRYTSGGSVPGIELKKSLSDTVGSHVAITSSSSIGRITAMGSDGANFVGSSEINFSADGTVSTGIIPGKITISTVNSSGTSVERMRIDSSGNVGIGMLPGQKLSVNGSMEAIHQDGAAMAIRIRANASNNSANLQFTNNAATTDWAYIGSPSAGTMVIRSVVGATSPGNYAWLGINGGPVQIRDITAAGGEASDWPVPSLSIASFDDYTHNTMLGFLLKDDDNYILDYSKWNIKVSDTGSKTTSASTTNMHFGGPGALIVYSGNAERMRIDNSGNVGIGANSPSYKVDIQDSSTGNWYGLRLLSAAPVTQGYSGISLEKGPGYGGIVAGYLHQSTGSGLQILTNNGGTVVEVARAISNGSSFLIGYTTTNSTSYKLQVNSQIFATSSSIATSDGRYKENVLPITSGLDIIDSLNPVSFNWKEHPVHNFVPGKTVGFIAQEVKEALKDYEWVDNIIKTNYNEELDEEFLGIAESNIIPLLVAAVKELRAEVNTLKAQVNN